MSSPLTAAQRLLAAGLVLGVTLVAFEVTAVITALPTITDELDGDSLYGVTLAAYTLANLVALVAAGELADRYGPTKPYAASVVLFIIGLVVAAVAPAMWVVVLGRVLQGAGTGAFGTIAYLLVKRAFPEDRQPMMFAVLSSVTNAELKRGLMDRALGLLRPGGIFFFYDLVYIKEYYFGEFSNVKVADN